jgi:hypothetical protein
MPVEGHSISSKSILEFTWTGIEPAAFYRLEVEDASGKPILSAVLSRGVTRYRSPSWLKEKTGDGVLRWRVLALNQRGVQIGASAYRSLRLVHAQ